MKTMKATLIVVCVGLVILIATAFWQQNRDPEQTGQQRRDRCMYAAIEQAPVLKGKSAFEVVPECKDLPKDDREEIQRVIMAFINHLLTTE